jgi:hypothetical protein
LNLSEKRPFFGLQLDIFCFLVAFCLALIGFSSSHDYRSSIELLYRCTHTILLSSLRAKALRTSFAHSSLRSSLFVCPSFASSLLCHRTPYSVLYSLCSYYCIDRSLCSLLSCMHSCIRFAHPIVPTLV